MIYWLLCLQALVGMLLVVALLRPRRSIRRAEPEKSAQVLRAKIHVVRPVRAADGDPPGPIGWVLETIAAGVLFLMRQFAVRVLRAQWRLRQD